VKDTICGNLIVQFIGDKDRVLKALNSLEDSGLQTEIILELGHSQFFTEQISV